MTDKQYKKYLMQVNMFVIKSVWCKKCKQEKSCTKELQEKCCIRYEKTKHKDEWTFDKGLEIEIERDKQRKEKLKELKGKLKKR